MDKMKLRLWKKTAFVLILAEVFWCMCGIYIHECTHATLFFIETGKWGIPHFMDKVANGYGFLAVTIPPVSQKVGTMFSSGMQEIIAYAIQMFTTFVFAFALWKFIYRPNPMTSLIMPRNR